MVRNSSIETYRILATFAVLAFHFNGWLVGGMPKHFDIDHISVFRVSQAVIESFTCICVNMFLIISGFFGIKMKWQSILRICLLLASIHIPFYLVDCYFFSEQFEIKTFLRKFLVISNGGYFIQCYLMLMFLSPVLNSYIEKYGKSGVHWCVLFLVVEFWFDCITHADNLGFNHGFSVIHFVLIYMIARYLNLYQDILLQYRRMCWVIGYMFCSVLIFILYIFGVNYIWQYSNPVIVLSAICSFMPFLYRNYVNKWINWIAQSTLSVYVIHVNVPVYDVVGRFDKFILTHYDYSTYLFFSFCGIIFVFVLSILYDKIRLMFTTPIYNCVIKVVEYNSHEKK